MPVQLNEDWYPESQIAHVAALYKQVQPLQGAVLEFGCFEGRSTIGLAKACAPEELVAVDVWQLPPYPEGKEYWTKHYRKGRNVYGTFLNNIRESGLTNVHALRMNCHDYEAQLLSRKTPVKFFHLDACHVYEAVKRSLVAIKPLIVPNGIMCGDDFAVSVHLNGGVPRAVREVLPGFEAKGNFWWWHNRVPVEKSGATP